MDIRGFFGGGGSAKKKAPSPAKPVNKRPIESEGDLIDSDEDEDCQQSSNRRRLQKKSEAKKRPIPAPDVVDISSPRQSPAAKKKPRVEDEATLLIPPVALTKPKPAVELKKLNSVQNASYQKKEVSGGVAGFFGEAPLPAKETAPSTPQKSAKGSRLSSPPGSAGRSPATRSSTRTAAASAAPRPTLATGHQGHAECFDGLKFAVSGVMDATGREGIENMVLEYGGKLVTAVSGKTSYLIAGSVLEDGRPVNDGSKYKGAVDKNVPIISENDFLALIQRRERELRNSASPPAAETAKAAEQPKATVKAEPTPYKAEPVTRKMEGMQASMAAPKVVSREAMDDMLWVDKYKPSSLTDVIGSSDTVKKLTDWLRRWNDMHVTKTFKPPFLKENPGAKAALLSGPPGIGKTTVATIVARSLGYQVLEMNASDARNKKSIQEELTDVVMSRSMNAMGSVKGQRRLIIMDEVDGMGGSDRGGVAELIKVIKNSKTPIICICNDRQSTKIRSLANSCYDLRVKRPTKTQIANRLIGIARAEGLRVEQNAAEMLVEQTGNDIRQVVNAMQMWRAQSESMTFMDVKTNAQRIEKDKMLRNSPFDACGMILGGGQRESFDDRFNSFFIDYSLVPLLVQQNYIDSSKNGIFKTPGLSDVQRLEQLAAAADTVCDMDLVGAAVMGADQHWELLPAQAAMAVSAGAKVHGFQSYPTFPQWLGKYSSTGKSRRLVQELVLHSSMTISQGFTAMRLEYVPYLRTHLLQPLLQRGSDGAQEVISILDKYGLSKDDFMETMKDFQFLIERDPNFPDLFERLDSKVKAALTRLYNSTEHRSQALVDQQAGAGGKGRGGGGNNTPRASGGNEFVAEDDDAVEEEETDNDDGGSSNISAFMKKGGGKRKAAGGKSVASKKSKSK